MHTSDHSAMHHLIQIIHHVVQFEMTPESEQKPPANEVQEGFESIIRAKLVAHAESLESDIRELATARTDVVNIASSSTRWVSIVTSALSANLVLLVKRPESETLWLGQKMLLLLCCQAFPREDDVPVSAPIEDVKQ
jgi:hypothetical protein